MTLQNLLRTRLHLVTGKGGVGKSTVAAALALLLTRQGKRVLVCEVRAREAVGRLLGHPLKGAAIEAIDERLFALNIEPAEAIREYALLLLRSKTLYKLVFENKVVRLLLRVVPGLAELVTLGKIWFEEGRKDGNRPHWDAIVVDAPATGHAVQLLRMPDDIMEALPKGVMRDHAMNMKSLLTDATKTRAHLVALPEELPVNEAQELYDALTKLHIPFGLMLANAVTPAPFLDDRQERIARVFEQEAHGPAADAMLEASRAQADRRRSEQGHLFRLREGVKLHEIELPRITSAVWGRAEITQVADAIERQLV